MVIDDNNATYTTTEKRIVAYGDVDLLAPLGKDSGAKESEATALLNISPNPTNGETTVEIDALQNASLDSNTEWELEIYSSSQILKQKLPKLKGCRATINTRGWKEGIYVARVKLGNKILVEKFVVKK